MLTHYEQVTVKLRSLPVDIRNWLCSRVGITQNHYFVFLFKGSDLLRELSEKLRDYNSNKRSSAAANLVTAALKFVEEDKKAWPHSRLFYDFYGNSSLQAAINDFLDAAREVKKCNS